MGVNETSFFPGDEMIMKSRVLDSSLLCAVNNDPEWWGRACQTNAHRVPETRRGVVFLPTVNNPQLHLALAIPLLHLFVQHPDTNTTLSSAQKNKITPFYAEILQPDPLQTKGPGRTTHLGR